MPDGRFAGRVALVTGAGSPKGIGYATARILGRDGARVAIASTTDRIHDRVAELAADGIQGSGHFADLTDRAAPQRLIDEVLALHGSRLDILVNNAGMVAVGQSESSDDVLSMSADDWDRGIAQNLRIPFAVTKAALPHLVASGRGRIVFVSSVTGPLVSNPGSAVYGAAKAGIMGLVRTLA